MAVVDNFELDEVRAKIDEMFDSVTENLVSEEWLYCEKMNFH